MQSNNVTEAEVRQALSYIDPRAVDYQTWVKVGMAINSTGLPMSLWDEWSSQDSARYHGYPEIVKKAGSFKGEGITIGTLFYLAKQHGYKPMATGSYKPLRSTSQTNYKIIDNFTPEDLSDPEEWQPIGEIIHYIKTVFDDDDIVGYNTGAMFVDNKWKPCDSGITAYTADQIISMLKDDPDKVVGSYNREAGVWVRINPLDGKGVKDENVTVFRHALVESDSLPVGDQIAIMRSLKLPISALVFSGGKSVHAVVRIDAENEREYSSRVEYLYKVCNDNGLPVDGSNKNPARLSRLPGVIRGDQKQFLIDTHIGYDSFEKWRTFVELSKAGLPMPCPLDEVLQDPPEQPPVLIEGLLREKHKMMLSGESKAGKSFALIELAIAIAEGDSWMGYQCKQGRVFYINLEITDSSFDKRMSDVYKALGIPQTNSHNIITWHLRGKAKPLNDLLPSLLMAAKLYDPIAVIIDPTYKVITGDENSAKDMGEFCNLLEQIAEEVEAAIIYAHHHSKSDMTQRKSMNRASGSGVFARDGDLLIDMIELEMKADHTERLEGELICRYLSRAIMQIDPECWQTIPSQDLCDPRLMGGHAYNIFRQHYSNDADADNEVDRIRNDAIASLEDTRAYRLEFTAREFATPKPVNIFYNYPIHFRDDSDILSGAVYKSAKPSKAKTPEQKAEAAEQRKGERVSTLSKAYDELSKTHSEITQVMIADYLGVDTKTVNNYVQDSNGDFYKETVNNNKAIIRRRHQS